MRDRGVAWTSLPPWGGGDPRSNRGGPIKIPIKGFTNISRSWLKSLTFL